MSEKLGNATCTTLGSVLVLAAIISVLVTTLLGLTPTIAIGGWVLGGGGVGLMYPRLSTMTLAQSLPNEQGFNSSALAIGDSLGSALSLALTGVAFAALIVVAAIVIARAATLDR